MGCAKSGAKESTHLEIAGGLETSEEGGPEKRNLGQNQAKGGACGRGQDLLDERVVVKDTVTDHSHSRAGENRVEMTWDWERACGSWRGKRSKSKGKQGHRQVVRPRDVRGPVGTASTGVQLGLLGMSVASKRSDTR